MRIIDTANIVLNFHKGDQFSAELLLRELMYVKDGIESRYYLQYGDDWDSLKINKTIELFAASRDVTLSNELPDIAIPDEFVEEDPNDAAFTGLHTRRSKSFKKKFLNWNLCVYKYIQELDHFQILEPDCVVTKDGWIRDIVTAFSRSNYPIYGHLKHGRIGGELWATHWAGCSYYDGAMLRKLPLLDGFLSRYENPWWPYRCLSDTETSNNAFFGPAFSGYDATFDFFLYALYWREKSGSNDPRDWASGLESEGSEILCDFNSRLNSKEILERHFDSLSLFHGAKDDAVRVEARRRFAIRRAMECRDPGSTRRVVPSLQMEDLKGFFANERCIIMGNGPSLNKVDHRLLKENWTIGTNRVYLLSKESGFEPTFYCCVNPNVIDQFGRDIGNMSSIKWVRDHRRDLVVDDGKTFYMNSEPSICFVGDLEGSRWHEGWTVTYCAMQVAFYLGFSEVVLVGVDHHFPQSGKANRLVMETTEDSNHFDPQYFGPGVKWQYPDLEKSERAYLMARDSYEADGRRIYDATVGGRLTVFPRKNLEQILAQPPIPRKKAPDSRLRAKSRRILRRFWPRY